MIEHIRAKDTDTKTRYAIVGAGLVTGVIGLVWISTLPARFAEKIELNPDEETESIFEESGIGNVVTDTKSQLGNIIESIPNNDTTTPEVVEIDGALGTLGDAPDTETSSARVVEESQKEVQQNTPTEIPKSTEPKIILIGTTTSQKSE